MTREDKRRAGVVEDSQVPMHLRRGEEGDLLRIWPNHYNIECSVEKSISMQPNH